MKKIINDSLQLAQIINEQTDIVTDLTDVIQEELPKKSIQGNNEEATNTKILYKLDHINIDTSNLATKEEVEKIYNFMTNDLIEIIENHSPNINTISNQFINSLFEDENND